jgi:hypothetical protein
MSGSERDADPAASERRAPSRGSTRDIVPAVAHNGVADTVVKIVRARI